MKKYIVTLVAVSAAASVLAQGTVNFSTRVTGVVVGHVYGPESTTEPGKYTSLKGNTATETPSGTQVYAGGFLTGAGWSAQLYAAPGANADVSSLQALPAITSFRTGTTLGGTPATSVVVVPGVAPGTGTGTFQIRAWDNQGGTLTTWAQAEVQWKLGLIAAGESSSFNVSGLGDGGLNLPANFDSFKSFNVYFQPIPEPGTFALLGLGALGMLIFRRK